MPIRFIGANPGITLFDGDERVAFASVWRADWSERGSGRAIVLWHKGVTRVATTNSVLGDWLASEFTRHFPEVAGLPWPDPVITECAVDLDLGGIRHQLSTLFMPCQTGSITINGIRVTGDPKPFIAHAEVWSRQDEL